jgi:hypothetical protein
VVCECTVWCVSVWYGVCVCVCVRACACVYECSESVHVHAYECMHACDSCSMTLSRTRAHQKHDHSAIACHHSSPAHHRSLILARSTPRADTRHVPGHCTHSLCPLCTPTDLSVTGTKEEFKPILRFEYAGFPPELLKVLFSGITTPSLALMIISTPALTPALTPHSHPHSHTHTHLLWLPFARSIRRLIHHMHLFSHSSFLSRALSCTHAHTLTHCLHLSLSHTHTHSHLCTPLRARQVCAGFDRPTPIQSQTFPVILSGRDCIGIASTGSGKTLAFGLPGLLKLHSEGSTPVPRRPGMLVVAPTRELAVQTSDVCEAAGGAMSPKLMSVCVFGGVPKGPQTSALRAGAHIVVATPGRLFDLMEQGEVHLDRVTYLVLDEADRMLDLG